MEKKWLENKLFYSGIDEDRLTSIFYFPLVWNLFEKKCCNGNAQINKHAHEIANNYAGLLKDDSDNIWRHFQKRYIKNDRRTQSFEMFTFKENDNKQWVETVLRLNGKATDEEKLEALLRIAFRLRNNLYHGDKDVSKLYEQNENFRLINCLLMALIDAHQEK